MSVHDQIREGDLRVCDSTEPTWDERGLMCPDTRAIRPLLEVVLESVVEGFLSPRESLWWGMPPAVDMTRDGPRDKSLRSGGCIVGEIER